MKKIIISCLVLLLHIYTYGQNHNDPRARSKDTSVQRAFKEEQIKNVENNAEYVFMGNVEKEAIYLRTDKKGKKYYALSQIINITKLFRGNLKSGTIEIVSTMHGVIINDATEQVHYFDYKRADSLWLFFCKNAGKDFPYNKKYNIYPVDNKIILIEANKYVNYSYKRGNFLFDRKNLFIRSTVDIYRYVMTLPNINKSVITKEDTTFTISNIVSHSTSMTEAQVDSAEHAKALKKQQMDKHGQ